MPKIALQDAPIPFEHLDENRLVEAKFAAQPFRAGQPEADIDVLPAAELAGERLAGEGAAELGGCEVAPEARARAALELGLPRLRQAHGPVEALYVRAPNITAPRNGRRG